MMCWSGPGTRRVAFRFASPFALPFADGNKIDVGVSPYLNAYLTETSTCCSWDTVRISAGLKGVLVLGGDQ